MLRTLGAKMCWLKVATGNPLLTVKVLYALEGAIVGVHEAALPASRRRACRLGSFAYGWVIDVEDGGEICRCKRPISGSKAMSKPIC